MSTVNDVTDATVQEAVRALGAHWNPEEPETAMRAALEAVHSPHLEYYDPARQDRISEHDCSFEGGAWWFGHGMPCRYPQLHAAEHAIAYIEDTWLGHGKPTRNTPAGEIIAILHGERAHERKTPVAPSIQKVSDGIVKGLVQARAEAAVREALATAERVYPTMVKGSDPERAMRALITALHAEEAPHE